LCVYLKAAYSKTIRSIEHRGKGKLRSRKVSAKNENNEYDEEVDSENEKDNKNDAITDRRAMTSKFSISFKDYLQIFSGAKKTKCSKMDGRI